MSKKRILCVDDNASILRTIKAILSREYEVIAAESANEAISLFDQSGPYPVLLTDSRMPGKSGMQLVRELKTRDPCIVAMVLTADSVSEETREAVARGEIFSYLHKPLKIDEMFRQVDLAFNHHDSLSQACHCGGVN
jgi:DNA-binding NtrC family response regulator